MTSIDSFAHLRGDFEHLVRALDIGMVIEHVRRLAPSAFARHFKGYRPQTLGRKRVAESLRFELYDKENAAVADILVLLWNQRFRFLYNAMLERVRSINEDVESIEKIEDDKANSFLDELLAEYDRRDVHICVRLNDVRFSDDVISRRLLGEPVEAAAVVEDVVAAGSPEQVEAGEAAEVVNPD